MSQPAKIKLENTHAFGYTDSSRSGGSSVSVGVAVQLAPYIRRDGVVAPSRSLRPKTMASLQDDNITDAKEKQ